MGEGLANRPEAGKTGNLPTHFDPDAASRARQPMRNGRRNHAKGHRNQREPCDAKAQPFSQQRHKRAISWNCRSLCDG